MGAGCLSQVAMAVHKFSSSGEGTRPFPCIDGRVLVVAPHPDDVDIIGCTLKHRVIAGGATLQACVLSCGSGVEDGYCEERGLAPSPENIRAMRRQEQIDGCEFLGLPAENLDFLELEETGGAYEERGQVMWTAANRERFCAYVAEKEPDVVFAPCVFAEQPAEMPSPMPHGAGNVGHFVATQLILEALARCGRPVAFVQHRDPKTISMRSDFVTTYTKADQTWKGEMLRKHSSQHARNLRTRRTGFDERLLRPEAERALELSCGDPDAAGVEVFQVTLLNCGACPHGGSTGHT